MKLIEMDLFKYHDKPKDLKGHHEANDIVPERIYNLAKSGKKLTAKQEDMLAKNAKYACSYAQYVLRKPWPKGEDVIAKDAGYAMLYALDVLRKPWPKGEDAIAKNAKYSYYYACEVLKGRFLKGEDIIAKHSTPKKYYEQKFKVKL